MNLEKALLKIADDAREALGANLVSLLVYGSHARGEARADSDINLFLVVKDHRAEALAGLLKVAPSWSQFRALPPVIFPEDQIARAQDTFVMEFTEMACARKVLAGSDPFADFKPDWSAVRRELEQEARQKRIALTRQWLASQEDPKSLRALIRSSVSNYFTLLRFVYLLERRVTETVNTKAVLEAHAQKPWFRADVWNRLEEVYAGRKTADGDLPGLMRDYLNQAILLAQALDQME